MKYPRKIDMLKLEGVILSVDDYYMSFRVPERSTTYKEHLSLFRAFPRRKPILKERVEVVMYPSVFDIKDQYAYVQYHPFEVRELVDANL